MALLGFLSFFNLSDDSLDQVSTLNVADKMTVETISNFSYAERNSTHDMFKIVTEPMANVVSFSHNDPNLAEMSIDDHGRILRFDLAFDDIYMLPSLTKTIESDGKLASNEMYLPISRQIFFKLSGETICKIVLSSIFGRPFPTCRPKSLTNPETGRRLELDCYNPSLKIACEYNGIQHYRFPNKYHRSIKDHRDQISRDKLKQKLCQNAGIFLITVPCTTVKNSDIEKYIIKCLFFNRKIPKSRICIKKSNENIQLELELSTFKNYKMK